MPPSPFVNYNVPVCTGPASSVGWPPSGMWMVPGLILQSGKILSWRLSQNNFLRPIPLLLIQVGQLSVTGKRICTKYWLTTYVKLQMHPRKSD